MKKMLICAPVTSRSGYGAHSRDLVWSFLRHNKYDPVKIKLMEWVLTKNNTIDLIDYSDLDMESFERKQQRSYWEELTDRKY